MVATGSFGEFVRRVGRVNEIRRHYPVRRGFWFLLGNEESRGPKGSLGEFVSDEEGVWDIITPFGHGGKVTCVPTEYMCGSRQHIPISPTYDVFPVQIPP